MPISFEDKARENLRAAQHLLPESEDLDDDDDALGTFPNASAARAYYAAYLAVAHRAQAAQRTFTSDKDYYKHDELPDQAQRWGLLDGDGCDSLEHLRDLRLKADYWEEHVTVVEAAEAASIAEGLVEQLLGPEVSE